MYELAKKKKKKKKRENKLGNREILNQMCKTFLTIYKKNYMYITMRENGK
jgi:hypothetical protein